MAAIGSVVYGHWLLISVTDRNGQRSGADALDYVELGTVGYLGVPGHAGLLPGRRLKVPSRFANQVGADPVGQGGQEGVAGVDAGQDQQAAQAGLDDAESARVRGKSPMMPAAE